jgi:cysteine desulfurase
MSELRYYFDYAASTPLHPNVLDSMCSFMQDERYFSNAHASHYRGAQVDDFIREELAGIYDLIGIRNHELYITSGATESINWILRNFSKQSKSSSRRIISSHLEHKATTEVLKHIRNDDRIEYVKNGKDGSIDMTHLEFLLSEKTDLVSIMHVNNELGVINDIEQIGKLCKQKGASLHVDAAQSIGKLPTKVLFEWADFITVSAHKLYGPKGIGGLFVPKGHILAPLLFGGGSRVRPGTLATHQVVGFVEAFKLIHQLEKDAHRLSLLVNAFKERLLQIDGLKILGSNKLNVPHIMSITISGVHAKTLQRVMHPFMISIGSSCNSTQQEPSSVLKSIGLSDGLASSTIRISMGLYTDQQGADQFLDLLQLQVSRLRNLSNGAPEWCQI